MDIYLSRSSSFFSKTSKLHVFLAFYLVIFFLAPGQAWTSPRHGMSNENSPTESRRRFLAATTTLIPGLMSGSRRSNAFPFGGDSAKDRRQKELCLVNLLRLQYWAKTVSFTLGSTTDMEKRKKAYLEARLGAKAMVAKKQKIGGGATPRVFMLVSLGIKECLEDLEFYAKDKKKMDQLKEDLIEALASIVEFDGLETTQDPSPRSSLTLGQYNDDKALFVKRMLSERIAPLTQQVVDCFGPETRAQCEAYIMDYYASELPPLEEKVQTITDQVS